MENENKNTAPNNESQNQWERADHQGDWQLAESDASDTAEMLTGYQADDSRSRLYATGNNPDEDDAKEDSEEEEEEISRDWGHTDPLDSPLPDSNDPSGPGSAV